MQLSVLHCTVVSCTVMHCTAVECSTVQCKLRQNDDQRPLERGEQSIEGEQWDMAIVHTHRKEVYSVQCTVYSVQCTLYSRACTVYMMYSAERV